LTDKEKLRQRFLRDPLPVRLGGIAATLGRISSSARTPESQVQVANMLDEAKHLIEWTAADTDPEVAADLVQIQRLIVLWQKLGPETNNNQTLRILLATLAKEWSEKTLAHSGLL